MRNKANTIFFGGTDSHNPVLFCIFVAYVDLRKEKKVALKYIHDYMMFFQTINSFSSNVLHRQRGQTESEGEKSDKAEMN